ncbi:MAG: SCO family protein [Acidobacteria bacterium]|nr:SCO family protein [Acidobacteriota bacterium]
MVRARAAAALAAVACGLLAAGAGAAAGGAERYIRKTAVYPIPDVALVDQDGAAVRLQAELGRPGPVLLQFIFTTCATVCPALSGAFAAAQERLPDTRLLSISIDPEEDTPARLAAYGRRLRAGPRWRLLTGRLDDVIAVERAFDVYRGNKMRHQPVILARGAPGQPWLRLTGLPTAADLAAEVRGLAAAAASAAPAPGMATAARPAAAAPPRTAPAARMAGMAASAAAVDIPAAISSAVARGRRIYREGALPSGRPLRALTASGGGVAIEDARLACATCHRASGYGGVEGGTLVPPITAPALFAGQQASAAELLGRLYREEVAQASWTRLRSAAAAQRPAYTGETLAGAVRRGTDPRGRVLDALMPRYALDDGAMADLAAYLRTLEAAPAPGVDAAAIHFGMVIAGDVEPERRRAMLDVAQAFVLSRNQDTRRQLSRPPASPGYRDELRQTWREWVLHVWELEGPEATWGEQLERSYRAQPVFALLSGIAAGAAEWRPVHELCERREIPCLFPNTDLPVVSPAGAWTLYLSAGLALEGRALARHLAPGSAAGPEPVPKPKPERVLQVYRDTPAGRTAAAALHREMAVARAAGASGARGATEAPGDGTAPRVEDLVLGADEAASPAALAARLDDRRPAALVLWLDRSDVAALLPALAAGGAGVGELDLSYSLLGEEVPPLPEALRERTRLTFRFALPGRPAPEGYRARAWLRSRGAAGAHERIRLDTWFALAMAGDAVDRLAGRFSRAFFVETIERETERAANPGVFPHLGLGAGQRFAAKGCYVVKLAAIRPSAGPSLRPQSDGSDAGDWIVP